MEVDLDPSTILSLLAVLISVLLYVIYSWKGDRNKAPPGPLGLPLLGYLPFFMHLVHEHFADLKENYGSIIRVKILGKDVVVLNDYESIREACSKEEITARPKLFLFQLPKILGVATINGEAWRDNRRFSLHVLRNLGFGKKSMEVHIKEEIQSFLSTLESSKGNPMNFEETLTPSMSNNIYALVFGRRLEYGSPNRQLLDNVLRTFTQNFSLTSIVNFLPLWLTKITEFLMSRRFQVLFQLKDYTKREIEKHEQTLDPNDVRDFIDGYLLQIKEHGEQSNFNKEYLIGNTVNFFGAGSNTVRISIQWHLLTAAVHPEIQKKMQQEIDEVIGRERAPAWEDHIKMPFTQAVIWEMYRWRTVAPVGVPRCATVDTTIGGYHVKANTIVLLNLWAVHNDTSLWKEPEKFNPYRFLSDDGNLKQKPDYLVPFSLGKRMCPGETLATVEIFLYLTSVLQKFSVEVPPNVFISLDALDSFITLPRLKSLIFAPR